jgi:ATP-dependent 26S proteasome regulatory subunit
VIFFDEIDAIVGKRSLGQASGGGSGDSVQERVQSMLLNEMDGVESAASVLVVVGFGFNEQELAYLSFTVSTKPGRDKPA